MTTFQGGTERLRALVLGAGSVGSVLARDLAAEPLLSVTVADRSSAALRVVRERVAETIQCDLGDPQQLHQLVGQYDLVLGALPGALGYRALEAVIAAGRNYCDVSFMAEDATALDQRARDNHCTVAVDCGVAPGLSHMLVGHAAAALESTERVLIYVGGLPRERRWPFQYKASFSPRDVIEEYVRPVRVVEQGRVELLEALSELEAIDLEGLGTLEAFNTDGLRSLVRTIEAPWQREKTLRYPGHAELMRALRHIGLFGTEPVAAGHPAVLVKPVDLAAALLFPLWRYHDQEQDLTVMRVIVEGQTDGSRLRQTWDLFDTYDQDSGLSSMSRLTAFPCAIVARWIARGDLRRPGVLLPEQIGADPELMGRMLAELRARLEHNPQFCLTCRRETI